MWSVFQAIKRSWTEHFVTQFSAFLILFLTYTAVLFISLSLQNIQKVFHQWGSVSQMTVYLKPQTGLTQKKEIIQALTGHKIVKSVTEVSSLESAEKFNRRFEKLSRKKIDSNKMSHLFPEYLEVSLNEQQAYGSAGVLNDFSAQFRDRFPPISSISYGESWLSSYSQLLTAINITGWLLIAIFMMGSMIVSASVVKSILFHRKDEIEVLEFIGADESFIYRPQLVNLISLGFFSFAFALLMNYSLFISFKKLSLSVLGFNWSEGLLFIAPSTVIFVFLISLSLLFIETLLTLFRMMPKYKKSFGLFQKGSA